MEAELKAVLLKEVEKMIDNAGDIDLALVDEDGLLLEEHIKKDQLTKYMDTLINNLYDKLEFHHAKWYKNETDFNADFIKKEIESYGILDLLYWLSQEYIYAKYNGYTKNIYVYDYNWNNYSDREFHGVWFGSGQFFDSCELGMVSYGRRAWKNRHN